MLRARGANAYATCAACNVSHHGMWLLVIMQHGARNASAGNTPRNKTETILQKKKKKKKVGLVLRDLLVFGKCEETRKAFHLRRVPEC